MSRSLVYRHCFTANGGKREMKIAPLKRALELNEFMRPRIECASNLYKHVNTDVGRSSFDFPEVGTANARHKGKLPLRNALRSAQLADLCAQASLFAYVLHTLSMRGVYSYLALYKEPLYEERGTEMDNCVSCGWPLEGGDLTLPWEDGDNEFAYIICPHCGAENTVYGYGEDDD